MSKRKEFYRAMWKGDAVETGDDLLLFLTLEGEPDRLVMFNVTPTQARRLESKMRRVTEINDREPTMAL